MPDWSYHVIFKPLLRKLPIYHSREFIHRGMSRIASIPGGKYLINFLGREETSPKLNREFQSISYINAIGLSGKVDPLLTGTKAFSNLGFGFLEIGPVTIQPLKGNSPLERDNRILFPTHCETIGLQATITTLQKLSIKQPLMIRLKGNIEELTIMMEGLSTYASLFIVERDESIDLTSLTTHTIKPVYLSIQSSEIDRNSYSEVASFSGLVLDSESVDLNEHLNALNYLKDEDYNGVVVVTGSIEEPQDALDLFDAGADLVLLSGGYIKTGPGLVKRIKEAQLAVHYPLEPANNNGWYSYWIFGFCILIGGILALLLSMTTVILPYDSSFLEMDRTMLILFNERILPFMAHDRMTLAGTMISGGFLYMFLARYGIRMNLLWTKQASDFAAITGFLGILLFIGYGYFDWLHLLFWLILSPFYIHGYRKSKQLSGTSVSTNRRNNKAWKKALYSQFSFVILGFSFVIGGIIISIVGVSSVFVTTDLLYLCMTPEMLDAFNDRLIPVIAHDRAGFGSALLSVGILVLTISLWGFQQGQRWIWWAYLIGGLPAFISAISIHFSIGYTTFIHLLPAYFAAILYVIGLITSFQFFHLKSEVQ
ncbi:dihydroorotate dehydrogenase [Bacillus suaedae]|uniref:Dihydroorotate dehydrogenase n=1 Tax=Halalkalibacter suaedae TaxID=2822140 RepID=A0A940WRL4_9BACI|nr:dihydroorotate dehydrogenase [Bacillus suaedae]MBP3951046.1 dihydroorotate dehydrogenase [Bacillus suaedae]